MSIIYSATHNLYCAVCVPYTVQLRLQKTSKTVTAERRVITQLPLQHHVILPTTLLLNGWICLHGVLLSRL